MHLSRRRFLHLAGAAGALPAASRRARAQAYPTRPLRWIVGFPPGGGADIVSRFDNLPFNLVRDIAPVSGLIDFPLVMVANPSVPAQTVAEFIAYAKASPGKISIGSYGTGSTSHE